jgi:hypothetical protein
LIKKQIFLHAEIQKEILQEFVLIKNKIIIFGLAAGENYGYDSDNRYSNYFERKNKEKIEMIAYKILIKYDKK